MDKKDLYQRLEGNALFKELVTRSDNNPLISSVIDLIINVGIYSVEISKTIIMNMPEFTLHDENHIFNMLYLTQKLIPEKNLQSLSSADIMMIILAIFLHDIGMAPPRELVMAWKGQLPSNDEIDYEEEISAFRRFRETCIRQLDDIAKFNAHEEFSKAQLIEDQIITDYIRRNHSDRARKMIASNWGGKIKFGDTDLTADLAEVCFSHNENYMELLNMETIKLCDEDTVLCLPFVAIILRLADIIDFDTKRTPSILFSHLTIKNPVSLKEWVKHISINAWSFKGESITFSAQCFHPAIEATIRSFCDMIDDELRNCTFILANLYSDISDVSCYKIKLPAFVNRSKIGAKKEILTGKPVYTYHDTKFTLSKKQVVDLLMGTQLYGKPEFALRELIQNSIDTCMLRKILSESWKEEYTPYICIEYKNVDGEDYLIVEDNGMGMNQEIVDKYYTNLGNSYYTSSEFLDLLSKSGNTFKPISRFGIGILSCFMVCDSMEVNTKRLIAPYQSDEPLKISIDGYDSLFVIKQGERPVPGTTTILRLRETHPWLKMNKEDFVKFVRNLLPLPPFDIDIKTDTEKFVCTPDSFEELDIELEKDYSWEFENNVKIVKINLNDPQKGFRGKGEVALIVNSQNELVGNVNVYNKEVYINHENYLFSSDISYGKNSINKNSTTVDVDENGDISVHDNFYYVAKSDSIISIHGIDVPTKLFKRYGEKTELDLPFPIRFRLDIGNTNDLNLNSSRTQIIYDEVWLHFENQFYDLVCQALCSAVGESEWKIIKSIFRDMSISAKFKEIMLKIE